MMTSPDTVEYNPNVPQKKETIGKSQLDFFNNFFSLYEAFSNNHVALDAALSAGNHTVIELPEQDSDTQFQTDVGEISVYCKNVSGQTDQIFLKYQGPTPEFQFTNYQIYSIAGTGFRNEYFTFLPGKVLVYFGNIITNLSSTTAAPLLLRPPIAKNIISMNFVPIGTTPGFSPRVTLQQPIGNIYSTINLFSSAVVQAPVLTNLFYVVMANV